MRFNKLKQMMQLPKRNHKSVSYKGEQSWHHLKRGESPSEGIRTGFALYRSIRRWITILSIVLILAATVWFFKSFVFRVSPEAEVSEQVRSGYLSKVLFDSDGVLDEGWLSEVLPFEGKRQLMEINIFEIKNQLESFAQVKQAEVIRLFPDSLRIDLSEAQPLFKMQLQFNGGATDLYLVSEEGILYRGQEYSEATINALPYLIPFRHAEQAIQPIQGIAHVADLLRALESAKLSERIRLLSVSLESFSGDLDMPGQIIEIRSGLIPEIVFSANQEFSVQIARLNYILSYLNGRGNPDVERVDLSLRASAAVQFRGGQIDLF